MMPQRRILLGLAILALLLTVCGCRSSKGPAPPQQLDIERVDHTPFGSAEIKQCASEMGPRILMVPEIQRAPATTRIVVQPLRNSSTIMLDTRMITDALKNELMFVSQGRVRFITEDDQEIAHGNAVILEKLDAKRDRMLDEVAASLLQAPAITNAAQPPIVAVVPALNTNLVGMNADSFVAILRAKIAGQANGKVLFTAPRTVVGAEYLLTGEFIAESFQQESMINLIDYVDLVEERINAGQSMDVYDQTAPNAAAHGGQANLTPERRQALMQEIEQAGQMATEPNVNKLLNVMLIRAKDKVAVMEKMFSLEPKLTRGLDRVEYTLTGNISSQSRYSQGREEIYIVVTLKLIEPETKEEIWAGRYETKKSIERGGVVY